jgi:ribonuclease P protein component
MNAEGQLGAEMTRMGSMKEPKSAVWLTQRAEFLAAAKGRRHHAALFTIQAIARRNSEGGPRFGLTVTTKTGNSVERSRIKRRLREAIRLQARLVAFPGTDYVLIGRRALLDASFETITAELIDGISRLKPRQPSSLKPLPSSP